jgi:hypothetical protein
MTITSGNCTWRAGADLLTKAGKGGADMNRKKRTGKYKEIYDRPSFTEGLFSAQSRITKGDAGRGCNRLNLRRQNLALESLKPTAGGRRDYEHPKYLDRR